MVGQRIFRERSTPGTHDLVADLDAFGVGSELGDFARPFHAEHRANAAGCAMRMALGHAEVGAIEAAGGLTSTCVPFLKVLQRRKFQRRWRRRHRLSCGFPGLFSLLAAYVGGLAVIARFSRHCERSEAIHSFFRWRDGLLRFARNDGEGAEACRAQAIYSAA
jgi:hypothetical protein